VVADDENSEGRHADGLPLGYPHRRGRGHDIFESPEELTALLGELSAHGGSVELVLAGDFFDFLEIGEVPNGENRASVTMSRPEYRKLFSALRDFAAGDSHKVIYLPGNHDAEVWWNPAVQKTLRKEGLVDEFALSYAARFESVPGQLLYCEHGNQFDPTNTIRDYEDPLDTPLGDHIDTDLTRGLVAAGRLCGPRGTLGTPETSARASTNCGANLDRRPPARTTRRGRRAAYTSFWRTAKCGIRRATGPTEADGYSR
jgi:3',5'-cyclic AMP phosphodiesterase CpdA